MNEDRPSKKLEIFNSAIKNNFLFLKQTFSLADLYAKSIALENGMGFLVPLCEFHAQDKELISALAKWRVENQSAYPTQFPVTIEGTSTWLRAQVLNREDRILFLIINRFGKTIGHMGFSNSINDSMAMEADNIVRGIEGDPGIMSEAMNAMLDWAEEMFRPNQIFLRVFQENVHAINFYKKLGFQEKGFIALRRFEEKEKISFRPLAPRDDKKPDKTFVKMIYLPKRSVGQNETILTAGPSISAREISYVLDAAKNGWNQKWNDYLKRFEDGFARYVGARYAIATSSCTGALHIALAALGIGPGDEVIVPEITWVATANAVLYVGATPVFADVDLNNWCLDPDSFESLINSKTKAVIPVHLYGHPAPMDKIMKIANQHQLLVVEDAAPAIGATYNGKKTGTFGHFSAFSFQGAKLLVTGEGGVLLTDDEKLFKKAYSIWDQGRVPGTFWIESNGLKYKMSNIQAGLGLGQLERVDEFIEAKRQIFSWYEDGLKNCHFIKLSRETPEARSIYWMSSLYLSEDAPVRLEELRKKLKECRIDTRPVFPAISQYPIWGKPFAIKPNAKRIMNQGMNLPSGVCLKKYQVEYVCDAIRNILK